MKRFSPYVILTTQYSLNHYNLFQMAVYGPTDFSKGKHSAAWLVGKRRNIVETNGNK